MALTNEQRTRYRRNEINAIAQAEAARKRYVYFAANPAYGGTLYMHDAAKQARAYLKTAAYWREKQNG